MVSPAMVTVTLPVMSKTRLASLPLMVNFFAPRLSMSRLLSITRSPLVSVIVLFLSEEAKRMVSPLLAVAI
jgi:hypothetical protein